jgi:hypothetical protein
VTPGERDAILVAARACAAVGGDIEERAKALRGSPRERALRTMVGELAVAIAGLARAVETLARR